MPLTEGRLQDTWYGDRRPGLLLRALERVYAGVSAARRQRSRPAEALAGKPIVVVGNITAGGTGKTPLVIRLCELLQSAGIAVAVVSRGYGRAGSGPVAVVPDTPTSEAGDEPVLIARARGVPVFVDEDREAAALAAFEAGARVVLSDDGLQRTRLPRMMELCVVDAQRGFGNGRLLPAGPLREPLERLHGVDWIISNGEVNATRAAVPAELAHKVVEMRLQPTTLTRLDTGEACPATEAVERLAGVPLTAVAGMGNPGRFFDTLAALGLPVVERRPLPDHHDYVVADFSDIPGAVIMTEKDAVKCATLGLENAWVLGVGARLPEEWERNWLKSIAEIIL